MNNENNDNDMLHDIELAAIIRRKVAELLKHQDDHDFVQQVIDALGPHFRTPEGINNVRRQ